MFAVAAAAVSQAGMALVVKLGQTYRPVTVKSTVFLIAVSLLASFITAVWYELFGRKGTGCFILAGFCLAVTVHSLLCPKFGVYYRYTSLAAILAVVFTAVPLILGRHEREKKKHVELKLCQENVFVAIALIAGIWTAVALPVSSYNSWDDENHYERVVYMSQGIYATETGADIKLIYSPSIKAGSEEAAEYAEMLNAAENSPENVLAYNSAKAFYHDRIGYLGILGPTWLARMLDLPFTARYIAGRLGNLLLYCALMYCAIRHLNRGKTLMTVLALAPSMVFLASNYSCDPWVFSFAAVCFSYFFRAVEDKDEKLTWRETVIMLGALVLAIIPKLPYLFLLLFMFLLPKTKFEDKKQLRNYRLLVIACIFALFVLLYATSFAMGDVADDRFTEEHISALDQMKFIFSDMKGFILMMLSFLKTYLSPNGLNEGFCRMGFLSAGIWRWVYFVAFIAAAVADGPSMKAGTRILGILLCVAMAALLGWIFYLLSTPVGYDHVEGCQQRYYLPVLFPLSLSLLGGYLKTEKQIVRYVPIAAACAALFANVAGIVLF